MFLKIKRRILGLIDTVSDMLKVLHRLEDPTTAISDCLDAVDAILLQLDQEEAIPKKTIEYLQGIRSHLYEFYNNSIVINKESVKLLNKKVFIMKSALQVEVKVKLNIVFFPYKASMWDSLATIYEAASRDENCIAKVVPIPYYELTQDKATPVYEGDRFPINVPITHYSKYNLEEEQPDIIFVHNIYDEYNTLTRVYKEYFTSNLKRYTDMLVYVPYLISSFIPPQKGDHSLAYTIPTVKNVDKIVLVGEFIKKAAIRDGIPANKLLPLGSPKLDAIVNVMKEEISYPKGWKEKVEGKTVYLLNTGCMTWANHIFYYLTRLTDFFNITRYVENSVLIWRPHPLTEISIRKYAPFFYEYYRSFIEALRKNSDKFHQNIILDESDDYLPALKVADVLISQDGSLLRSYLLTEKKVLFWGDKMPSRSLLPPDVFYYVYDQKEPWYEIVKKFSQGYDPLAQNRKGMASKIYANIDGTCGEKAYQTIKQCVLEKN